MDAVANAFLWSWPRDIRFVCKTGNIVDGYLKRSIWNETFKMGDFFGARDRLRSMTFVEGVRLQEIVCVWELISGCSCMFNNTYSLSEYSGVYIKRTQRRWTPIGFL